MTEATGSGTKGWPVFCLIAVYLIAMFLWRFFVPAHEYPMRPEQLLDIGLDIVMFVCLIGLRSSLSGVFGGEDSRRTIGNILFWCALVAGIGLFVIRFSSDDAWWTGHRLYYLLPR